MYPAKTLIYSRDWLSALKEKSKNDLVPQLPVDIKKPYP